jgi:hypothetical protein
VRHLWFEHHDRGVWSTNDRAVQQWSRELYSQDTFQGRAIYVRFIWRRVDANKTQLEQAFSENGGKTWETNWMYEGQRVPE